MPRLPRVDLIGYPQHVIQRGHSREPCFADRQDYLAYKTFLRESTKRYECEVHAYVLMTNHVHLLLTPRQSQGISRTMQLLGRRYVRYFNHTYGKSGTLWEGRYKASLIDSERYLLTCARYIELNPVRADMVEIVADYPWSSYHANALGKADPLITSHELYLRLAHNEAQRQSHYRELFDTHMPPQTVGAIRTSAKKNLALGSDRFKDEIDLLLNQRIRPARMGRPPKEPEQKTDEQSGTQESLL